MLGIIFKIDPQTYAFLYLSTDPLKSPESDSSIVRHILKGLAWLAYYHFRRARSQQTVWRNNKMKMLNHHHTGRVKKLILHRGWSTDLLSSFWVI